MLIAEPGLADAEPAAGLGEHVAEDADELVELGLPRDERRLGGCDEIRCRFGAALGRL